MNKNARTLLIVGALAVGAYLVYRWYVNRKNGGGYGGLSPVSQLGTNLNSLAPELVGGSSGPVSGPQVTMPVTITLSQSTPEPAMSSSVPMIGADNSPDNQLTSANSAPASQTDATAESYNNAEAA